MGLLQEAAVLILVAALAAGAGAALLARCGPVDAPNERSSHMQPRPRAGGLSLILAAGAALLALQAGAAPLIGTALGADAARLGFILAACGAAGLVGVLDDLSLLGLRPKFAGIAAAAALGAAAAGPVSAFDAGFAALDLPYWLALAGSAFWVFVVINTVNFMDGVDGMMAASMGVAGVALAALGAAHGAPAALVCGALLAGALLGFAPLNALSGSLFAGDVGALFAGVLFASGALDLSARGGAGMVWVAPLLIAPLLVDVFATLLARARRGAPLAQGHREHLYQLLTQRGWPHQGVAALYAGAGVLCALAGVAALEQGPAAALGVLLVVTAGGLAAALVLRGRLWPRAAPAE